ncbi:phosphatidate cytidylyltransferase [Allopusillimonas soli]|uniref:Phosphatidate cytidylyltransferase n=1 Tax=Allopusillimonas soli TaxID=659016 RepID=A0A853F7V3_9BURK|nr:phosphatidate cytidylyltransferase [Allopusillimonas soli]NYT36684.1 phosphatidate cytidylyltransferase [Allopusillimonas soli]TEA75164.1 phosphatidate cytidylyltransferase [Allopusillimonas soli]
MLKQRVLTAIVLLVVLLAALLAPTPWPLAVLLTLMAACALWEWLRLTQRTGSHLPAGVAAITGIVMLCFVTGWLSQPASPWTWTLLLALNDWAIPCMALAWVLGATTLVVQGQATHAAHGRLLSLFGLLAVVAAWAALLQLFRIHGAWFLVTLLALIWFADIAAYFTGRAFGRRKLAPRVSPGKTWEGAIGGVAAATLWVSLTMMWPGSFGHELAQHWPAWSVPCLAALLAALSIVGDLFESLLKRRAGVKDSSQLLPGHGGVYDRIDALLPVAPVAFMLITGHSMS